MFVYVKKGKAIWAQFQIDVTGSRLCACPAGYYTWLLHLCRIPCHGLLFAHFATERNPILHVSVIVKLLT